MTVSVIPIYITPQFSILGGIIDQQHGREQRTILIVLIWSSMEVVNAIRFSFALCQPSTTLPTLLPIHLATCKNTANMMISVIPHRFKR